MKLWTSLKKPYEKYPSKKVPTENIGKMAHFVLQNNLSLILSFINKQPCFWKRFIADIFLYGHRVKGALQIPGGS